MPNWGEHLNPDCNEKMIMITKKNYFIIHAKKHSMIVDNGLLGGKTVNILLWKL